MRISFTLDGPPNRAAGAAALESMLKHVHLFTMSDELVKDWLAYFAPLEMATDAEARCAALVDILFQLSPTLELAVITRGKKGLVARGRHREALCLPAFTPINLVDPTGAGDVFLGTLLAMLLELNWDKEGLPGDIVPCLVNASAAAALNCERLGATSQIPTRQEVADRLSASKTSMIPQPAPLALGRPTVLRSVAGPLSRLIAGIPAAVKLTLGKNDYCALNQDFERTKTLAVVGSGSSYSLAESVQGLVSHLLPAPYSAISYHPLSYLENARPGETVLVISQGGNPDAVAACECARNEGLEPFLVTANRGRWAKSFPTDRVFYHVGEPFRSFVNVRGPCAALALIIEWLSQYDGGSAPPFADYERRFDDALACVSGLALQPSPARSLIGLAKGLMLGPLHELDLKAAEAGLEMETSELKGFTHGRYQRPWARRKQRSQAFITFETPEDSGVVTELVRRFNGPRNPERFPFYRLTASADPLGLWQHLLHVMLLMERISPSDCTMQSVPPALKGINYEVSIKGFKNGAPRRRDSDRR